MHVEEIDLVDAEPAQALVDGLAAVLGGRVDVVRARVRVKNEPELGGQEDVPAPLRVQLQPGPDGLFAVPVRRRRVPVRAAEFPGAVEEFETLFVGSGGVFLVSVMYLGKKGKGGKGG